MNHRILPYKCSIVTFLFGIVFISPILKQLQWAGNQKPGSNVVTMVRALNFHLTWTQLKPSSVL